MSQSDNDSLIVSFDNALNAGIRYTNEGQYIPAEKSYLLALEGYKRTLGPIDSLTLRTAGCLAINYASRSLVVEAETMYIIALNGHTCNILSRENMTASKIVESLDFLYNRETRRLDAEAMSRRAGRVKKATDSKDVVKLRGSLDRDHRHLDRLRHSSEQDRPSISSRCFHASCPECAKPGAGASEHSGKCNIGSSSSNRFGEPPPAYTKHSIGGRQIDTTARKPKLRMFRWLKRKITGG